MDYKKYLSETMVDPEMDSVKAGRTDTKYSVIASFISQAQDMLTSVGDAGLDSRDANRAANAIQRLINDLSAIS